LGKHCWSAQGKGEIKQVQELSTLSFWEKQERGSHVNQSSEGLRYLAGGIHHITIPPGHDSLSDHYWLLINMFSLVSRDGSGRKRNNTPGTIKETEACDIRFSHLDTSFHFFLILRPWMDPWGHYMSSSPGWRRFRCFVFWLGKNDV